MGEGKLDDVSNLPSQPFTSMVFSPVGKKKLAGQCEDVLLLRGIESDWDIVAFLLIDVLVLALSTRVNQFQDYFCSFHLCREPKLMQ